MAKAAKIEKEFKVPTFDWRTTDAQEVERRRQRAREESFVITNATPEHPVFSNFQVKSGSGLTYSVEVRDLKSGQFACDCVDFRINGLGLCKHVEAVRMQLEAHHKRLLKEAIASGSNRIEITVDREASTLRAKFNAGELPKEVAEWFGPDGRLADRSPEDAVEALRKLQGSSLPLLRLSQEIQPWLETRLRLEESRESRRAYEQRVQRGEWPAQETNVPLFPYQREGMVHLAFKERALLADEMGLGKTIQAIAACALLHRLGKAKRVLVVTPASLKTEWEEQIRRFTPLSYRIVFGSKISRLAAYDAGASAPFFTIVNYEQMLADSLDVNHRLAPDIVVLDEAQRIKNWDTKTAQAIKRLRSRFAFVLTGTPIENRIDELHSLMDFLDPGVLGPLFRFNREYYDLDDRGRPEGFKNLDRLHERIKPFMLRRRKADVETELPVRTDRNHFVPLGETQKQDYDAHEAEVVKLGSIARRRPLTKQEQDKLMRELAMMRMICDTTYILNPDDRTCPKLAELEKILEESAANDAKVIVFSEWERMLELVRECCRSLRMGFAWHTGSVPQQKRRAEINAFKDDPKCRVFLSTDAGATGLNLQVASVVINCDLPWNPAKLEQRIARAWRKNQTRPVTVINLISENTIEHRMLETLALKQTLASSVLDKLGGAKSIKLSAGRQAFVERLQQLLAVKDGRRPGGLKPQKPSLPADKSLAFAELAAQRVGDGFVRCEERFPQAGPGTVLVVVVERDSGRWGEALKAVYSELYGPGKSDPLAPVLLEVIDRTTDEAMKRMIAAGLMTLTTRACRPLPASRTGSEVVPLTPAELAKAKALREHATRKLKLARVLGESGFGEECRRPLLEAIHSVASALAVEQRLPVPSTPEDAVTAPLSHAWGTSLTAVRLFLEKPDADWNPALEVMEKA